MKKLVIMCAAALMLGAVAKAQNKTQTFVQAGVAVSNDVMYESLEFGATTGKNTLSVIAESYNAGNDFSVRKDREYWGGIKYTRGIAVGQHLSFLMSAAAKMHIDSGMALQVEPGVGLGLNLGKNIAFVGTMSSPIYQNTTPFKSLQLKAGVGVQVKI